jgi:hypothetical protein
VKVIGMWIFDMVNSLLYFYISTGYDGKSGNLFTFVG